MICIKIRVKVSVKQGCVHLALVYTPVVFLKSGHVAKGRKSKMILALEFRC
jgi:hypothetical protein